MKVRLNTKPAKKKNVKKKSVEKKGKIKILPSTNIAIRITIIIFIFGAILYPSVPGLLNFAPGSVGALFEEKIARATYTTIFFYLITIMLIVKLVAAKLGMKDIDKWYLSKNPSKELVKKIRRQCEIFPYRFFFVGVTIPVVILILAILILPKQYMYIIVKGSILLTGVVLIIDLNIFIFSKIMFDNILAKTYTVGANIGPRIGFEKRIIAMCFGVVAAIGIITAFIGYSGTVLEKGDTLYKIYNSYFEEKFDENEVYELNTVANILNTIINIT